VTRRSRATPTKRGRAGSAGASVVYWDAPAPYVVGFTTRAGGVSTGVYESLNLGALTEDDPLNVAENRRRACGDAGADAETATMAWQHHSAEVRKAEPRGIVTPGTVFEKCDGLWSDESGQAMMLLTADCLPVAIARDPGNGGRPALAILHVGWRGLLGGITAEGARCLAGGRLTGAIGPGIGPCCYEIGEEVAEPFRAAYGDQVLCGRNLDLWSAAEQALRQAGCEEVERTDLCTSCNPELFFSHRRDQGVTGRQGVVAYIA
jgi:purine-nucleoside/S-methyl-5'-thioadenosine phosphorylase / adenosine deaminase